MKLKEIKPNTVVYCNTEEEAKELIKWAYECGFCWQYEDEHLQTFWNHVSNADKIYKFYNNSIYISQLCNNRKSEIIEFSDLIIQESEPKFQVGDIVKCRDEEELNQFYEILSVNDDGYIYAGNINNEMYFTIADIS